MSHTRVHEYSFYTLYSFRAENHWQCPRQVYFFISQSHLEENLCLWVEKRKRIIIKIKKTKDYCWLKVDPRSSVNEIKAQEERNNRIEEKQEYTVGHSITSRISAYDETLKKIPTFSDYNTFL